MSFLQDSIRFNDENKNRTCIRRSTLSSPIRFLTDRRNNPQNITYAWEARLCKIFIYVFIYLFIYNNFI